MENRRNYASELKKYAREKQSDLKYEDEGSDEGPDFKNILSERAVISGEVLPIGVGKTEKTAKQNAAKNAPRGLSEKENQRPVEGTKSCCEAQKTDEINPDGASSGNSEMTSTQSKTLRFTPDYDFEKRPGRGGFGRVYRVQHKLISTENAAKKPTQINYGRLVRERRKNETKSFAVGNEENPAATGTTKRRAEDEGAKPLNYELYNSKTSEVEMNPDGATKGNSEMTSTQSKTLRLTSEYDVMELLGRGSFGRVYRVKQKPTMKEFAMKIVHFKEDRKALQEVKALSDLRHERIVQYYNCWEDDAEYQWDSVSDSWSSSQSPSTDSSMKYLYIKMELCDTKTLRDWIDEMNYNNTLPDSERRDKSLSIAEQLVSGVKYIHSKNLIHRDLKPANIMFGKENRKVKIGDFGFATAEKDDKAENLLRRTANKGTPLYMAPEQRDQTTYDRKVDIYAVGLIFFELFWKISTVREKQEYNFQLWDDVRRQKFPKGFKDNFSREYMIIKPALCMKPEDRPEASELKKQLKECMDRNNCLL